MASETRSEYQVVGDDAEGSFTRGHTIVLAIARRRMELYRAEGATNVRIQSRTVTETPWIDLPEEPRP